MATITDVDLYLTIDGASEAQLRRGLKAMRDSLGESGVSISDALNAIESRELGFEPRTPDEREAYLRNTEEMDRAFRAIYEASDTPLDTLIDFGRVADLDEESADLGLCYEMVRPDPNQMALAL